MIVNAAVFALLTKTTGRIAIDMAEEHGQRADARLRCAQQKIEPNF